jgi:two-component system, OmpR family, sensor histidine kinase KdpD
VWLAWWTALAVATVVLAAFRARVDEAHVVLVFLLVILGGSAAGGRLLGVLLSFAAFLVVDWEFLPPYGTLVVRNPLDWIALLTFLVTSLVAAQLLYVARARRDAVERAEALREAARLKDALIATVSHDLRTPLTSIVGLAHALAERGDEEAVVIEEEAQRLSRFVTDVLDVARLSTGNFPLDIQPNALDDLLGVVVRQFAGRVDRHRLRASLDHPDEIVIGHFDFAQSVRIVTNLVENALKYSPLDSPVLLAGGGEGDMLVVRVTDDGPGLPPEQAERAFEPFTRVTDAPPDTGSAGLGLSIARGLAEAQGGRIEYKRRAGGGSLFLLSLPAAPRSA